MSRNFNYPRLSNPDIGELTRYIYQLVEQLNVAFGALETQGTMREQTSGLISSGSDNAPVDFIVKTKKVENGAYRLLNSGCAEVWLAVDSSKITSGTYVGDYPITFTEIPKVWIGNTGNGKTSIYAQGRWK